MEKLRYVNTVSSILSRKIALGHNIDNIAGKETDGEVEIREYSLKNSV
jgi:hypothetical protein